MPLVTDGSRSRSAEPRAQSCTDDKRKISVWLEVEATCNLACFFCRESFPNLKGDPILYGVSRAEEVSRLARRLTEFFCICDVAVAGGEPLLVPDLEECIRSLRPYSQWISVCTNGTLLTEGMTRLLLDAGVDGFQISLHSAAARTHDEIVGQRGAWGRTVRGLLSARLARAPVVLVVVAVEQNTSAMADLAHVARIVGARGLVVNPCLPACGQGRVTATSTKAISVLHASVAAEWPRLASLCAELQLALELGTPLVGGSERALPVRHASPACVPPEEDVLTLVVSPSGNIRLCHASRTVLGNVFRDDPRCLIERIDAVRSLPDCWCSQLRDRPWVRRPIAM